MENLILIYLNFGFQFINIINPDLFVMHVVPYDINLPFYLMHLIKHMIQVFLLYQILNLVHSLLDLPQRLFQANLKDFNPIKGLDRAGQKLLILRDYP